MRYSVNFQEHSSDMSLIHALIQEFLKIFVGGTKSLPPGRNRVKELGGMDYLAFSSQIMIKLGKTLYGVKYLKNW